ncbi:MAG: ATP-binding protein [Eubacteriales bacterium]|jgi:two-component system sensor histidine kinase VicK
MFRSLHMKLVLILILLILSVMLVVGTLMMNRVTSFYLSEFRTQMEDVFTTQFLGELRDEANGADAATRLRDMLYAYAGPLGIDTYRQYYILDAAGSYLAGSDAVSGPKLEVTSNIIRALGGEIGDRMYLAESYMDIAIPLSAGDTIYIIYIKDSNAELDELKWMLFKITVQMILFGLLFAVLLSFLLSKTMTMPLENVTKGAARLASGKFDRMLEVQSADEIGELTRTFNHMAKTLQETLADVEGERNKLGTLFLHMTDGVAAFDKNGAIVHMNPAAEVLLGIPFSETLTYDEVLGDLPQPGTPTEEDQTPSVEYKRGERTLQVFLAPLGVTENERGTMAVIHDVTAQQKLESARREFVANVSHELRTPLTSIKSYTETLMETSDLPPQTSARFLGVINNEADRMARIVKDLLTLSRLDYGKFDLKLSRFPSSKMLTSVYDAMVFEAKNRFHTLTLDLGDNLPVITADRERIEQVVVNILANSVKYTPNGGTITLSGHVENGMLVISVSDNGVGIPKEDQSRLFERFYRVEKARTRDKGGTGLGLAIAAEIVRYHNGTISVESEVDVGTTMTVRLPIREDLPDVQDTRQV